MHFRTFSNIPGLYLGWEGPLEEAMAAHSTILAWRTPWTEEPSGLQPMGSPRVTKTFTCFHLKFLTNISFFF